MACHSNELIRPSFDRHWPDRADECSESHWLRPNILWKCLFHIWKLTEPIKRTAHYQTEYLESRGTNSSLRRHGDRWHRSCLSSFSTFQVILSQIFSYLFFKNFSIIKSIIRCRFSQPRHFYVAMDRLQFKMVLQFLCSKLLFFQKIMHIKLFDVKITFVQETLVDLLGLAGTRTCLPIVVCCSSRDELDAVCYAVSNLPYISSSSLVNYLVIIIDSNLKHFISLKVQWVNLFNYGSMVLESTQGQEKSWGAIWFNNSVVSLRFQVITKSFRVPMLGFYLIVFESSFWIKSWWFKNLNLYFIFIGLEFI